MLDVWCEQGLREVGWGQQALRGLHEGWHVQLGHAWCLRGLVRLQVALWLLAQLGVSTACCAFSPYRRRLQLFAVSDSPPHLTGTALRVPRSPAHLPRTKRLYPSLAA